MKKITLTLKFIIIMLIIPGMAELKGQAFLDVETGYYFSGYNDVRIPGDQGTLFSLSRELDASPGIFFRARIGYTLNSRHNISVLYAPLSIKSEGSIPRDISFAGEVFPANSPMNGIFKFNSYRLTYRYDIVESEKLEFGIGLTAKIRDAKISLESGDLYSEKINVGFVPIINFMLALKATEKLSLLLNGDALAAPQGRAEDILVALRYQLSDHLGLRAGYRILEGGADNDEVYTFSLINYASAGITFSF